MFSKLLIANRGEIAVRIARTARRLGIASVAVYSSADRDALHVEVCDEAFCIGDAAAADSYLNAERILDVAKRTGADAVHPGYGFLSENADFARACKTAGVVFIGPPATAIEAMGSKSEAKILMGEAGVPLVPGYHGDEQQDERLLEESNRIGYPQLIKASAGGGGKGMRLVRQSAGFAAALASARREAKSAFGDDHVLVERYLERPRHVELQVFADGNGNCVHLFERDCSIQRRHQKIIEEAPAPGLDDSLRRRMGKAAVDCAQAIGYVGAGTVEFLLDEDGAFYFMEMNTRLQVEHPVTEMITGIDLVEWQLRIAAGESLPLTQAELGFQGHAFEARIYAESPGNDFMPAAGRIGYLRLPETSNQVRLDTGVRNGDVIGIHYDPMIAKLIVHAGNRRAALQRLARALRQYQVLGLQTNLDFLTRLAEDPRFAAADFDTGFIEQHRAALFARDSDRDLRARLVAAIALLPQATAADGPMTPWDSRDNWRVNLPGSLRLNLQDDGESCEIRAESGSSGWRLRIEDREFAVAFEWIDSNRLRVELDGEMIEAAVLRESGSLQLAFGGSTHHFGIPGADYGAAGDVTGAEQPRAPMSGAVVAVPVKAGDRVAIGDTLMVIEAMKMEHAIVAQIDATVNEVLFADGDQVDEGDALVVLDVE